jgi:sugar lactone lactonase YvrE
MRVLLFLSSVFLLLTLTRARGATLSCDLVVGDPISCFDLQSEPFITSQTSQFGNFIEGASVNRRGHLFAVNYGPIGNPSENMNQLGQAFPAQRLFYSDELRNSLLNGIRFYNSSTAYVVDAVNHRVLALNITEEADDQTKVIDSTVFCSSNDMLQPNDLTLSIRTGAVFTSGMQWLSNTNETHGDIWACLQNGRTVKLEVMGRTNGIELSPDDSILYVSESYNRGGTPYVQKIWKYNVNLNSAEIISGKTLFADFAVVDGTAHVDIDGMKTDVNGNLYVTRHGNSQVVIFSPSGTVIGRISLNFPNPTNCEFGGPNGTTLFIVGKCRDNEQKGCVDTIEVTNPGRTWTLLQ